MTIAALLCREVPLDLSPKFIIVGDLPAIDGKRLVQFFQSADAIELTGLTRNQLREWTGTGRREVLAPDVRPNGPGRHALYSWQTLLVLRLLLVIHIQLRGEITGWSGAAKFLRENLEGISFPSLWEASAHFPSADEGRIVSTRDVASSPLEGIVLPLAPHLSVLATRISAERPVQLFLFPAMVVGR